MLFASLLAQQGAQVSEKPSVLFARSHARVARLLEADSAVFAI